LTPRDAVANILVRLSKPPFIEDLVKHVIEGSELEVQSLNSTPYARVELIKVLVAGSLQELDEALRSVMGREVEEIEEYMPETYRRIADFLRLLLELEGLPAELERGGTASGVFQECVGKALPCVLRAYFNRLAGLMAATGEQPGLPLSIVALALYGMYLRYSLGLGKIGLERMGLETGFEDIPRALGGEGSIYYYSSVAKLAEKSGAWADNPFAYIAEEARVVTEASKIALYYRGGLLNILTHFFIVRFYEAKLLRILVSRRILNVG